MSSTAVSSQELRRNLRTIGWLQALLATVALTIPPLTYLWIAKGLSVGQVMVLQAAFALAVAALEVPSGYVADVLGRKLALIIALAGAVLGSLAYSVADGFVMFLVGELLWAVALSFASGADYALFMDSLLALGEQEDPKRAWGAVRSNTLLVSAGCMILGGLLATWNLYVPLIVETALMVLAFMLAFTIREPTRRRAIGEGGAIREVLQIVRQALFENSRLRWLLLFPAVLLCMTRLGVWLYQPYFALSGVKVAYFGFIWAAFELAASMGSRWAYRVDAVSTERMYAWGTVLVVAGSYFALGDHAALLLGGLFAIQQVIRGITQVLFGDYLNQAVGSERRATFLSLQSMVGSVLYAGILLPLSRFTDSEGVLATLTINGVLTMVLGVATIWLLCQRQESD